MAGASVREAGRADQSAQERDGFEDQVGAAVGGRLSLYETRPSVVQASRSCATRGGRRSGNARALAQMVPRAPPRVVSARSRARLRGQPRVPGPARPQAPRSGAPPAGW